MQSYLSRRGFLQVATGDLVIGQLLLGDDSDRETWEPVRLFGPRSVVSVVHGDTRRKNIYESLVAIEDQLVPRLRRKKYVLIKPNIVSTTVQLASTHVEALHGILDFLGPRYKGPVMIAESAGGDTLEGYANLGYHKLASERRRQKVSLVDLNEEARYEAIPIVDRNLHVTPVRLAARLLDPHAFIICSAVLKTHNTVVATLSVKNMALGAPLHQPRKADEKWSDKARFHGSVRQTHYDILLAAQTLQPFWGAAVIDGFEGMEGDGPIAGTPVASRVAIASTDFIAADRVGLELMGINPAWPGYLNYCAQCGMGQYDLSRIEIRGPSLGQRARKFRMPRNIETQLRWMGPMTEG